VVSVHGEEGIEGVLLGDYLGVEWGSICVDARGDLPLGHSRCLGTGLGDKRLVDHHASP
jgi:hypothetical protein